MATRKLTAEVELKTDKAKRKLQELGSGGGGGGGDGGETSTAAHKLSQNLNRAAESASKLDRSSLSVVRAFTGIGIGLATRYAASHMEQGAARDAVEYTANTITGASSGAMAGMAAGPQGAVVGAIVGGVVGAVSTYLDKDSEKKQHTDEWHRSEGDYQRAKAFSDFYRGLTDMTDKTKPFSERISEAEAELKKLKDAEKAITSNVDKFISNGQYDKANLERGYLGVNRQRQQQLETAIHALKGAKLTGGVPFYAATDALAKVGGGNGFMPQATGGEGSGSAGASPASKINGKNSGSAGASPASKINGSFFFSVPQRGSRTRLFGDFGDPLMKAADDTIAILEKEGNDLLKEIAQNTRRNGGSTWQ